MRRFLALSTILITLAGLSPLTAMGRDGGGGRSGGGGGGHSGGGGGGHSGGGGGWSGGGGGWSGGGGRGGGGGHSGGSWHGGGRHSGGSWYGGGYLGGGSRYFGRGYGSYWPGSSYGYGSYYYPSYSYGSSYPSYGYGSSVYSYPSQTYSAARPVVPNTLSGDGVARIVNPSENAASVNYSLNDFSFNIPPGSSQTVPLDRSWVISFDRGGQFGTARYSLHPGAYTFTATSRGWELFHTDPAATQ